MKVNASTVLDILSRLRIYFQGQTGLKGYGEEAPLRSELFGAEQMNRHAFLIARGHHLLSGKSPDQLLRRLQQNEKILVEIHNLLLESIKAGKPTTPGAQWMLDNFYLVKEQIGLARKHLPKGYSEGLPYLADGPSAGLPRVYDIVLEIISHSDGRVDANGLSSFIASYQTHTRLTIGELWAIPIMLRLAVIENLRRVCGRIALDMIDHNLAEYWADRMIAVVKDDPADLLLVVSDMVRSKPTLSSPFVAGMIRTLQGKGPVMSMPLGWMEQQLTGRGTSSNEQVRLENQKQASDQVSVRNCIDTLRFIGNTNWKEFVETLSSVEQVLRQDPAGVYPAMDFATRDRYRHVVEALAKASKRSETEIAELVVRLADAYTDEWQSAKRRHVGHYLIDKGRTLTEHEANVRYGFIYRMRLAAKKAPLLFYLGSIGIVTFFIAFFLFHFGRQLGHYPTWSLVLLGIASLVAASQLAVAIVNWVATITVRPHLLPRMDFSKGIPPEYRTLVAVPTMLASNKYIDDLTESLEIRYLANKEENLHFVLLTDFLDARQEHLEADEHLTDYATRKIDLLNEKYRNEGEPDIFYLFHRPRTWNPKERAWMGYERKRGKLLALNSFLRTGNQSAFSIITGETEVLHNVKYVITLDSDTLLPRESAWKFVATMAHPSNQPVFHPRKRRVVEGYGILQPRVESAMPEGNITPYLRLQSDISGIDPYTQVSSDVYQDLFNEGSFIGKGIYDVSIFEDTLQDVFPDNRILSHDLLEGCYVRSGLVSDVFLYEDNPPAYEADMKRHHRWIRGDWQIGSWILPYVRGAYGKIVRNRLSPLSKWKIFDNLRRSLFPLSVTLLFVLGWFVFREPLFWLAAMTVVLMLPSVTISLWHLMHKPTELSLNGHAREVAKGLLNACKRFFFTLSVLPYEAFRYTDAIARTVWRIFVSRRNLLQWTPSAAVAASGKDLFSAYRNMFAAPLVALVSAALLASHPKALLEALPVIALWLAAPYTAWKFSQPDDAETEQLPSEQLLFLHRIARKTWAYFEQFVTADDNWLPPDNYQEQPIAVLARRTSPTNMGLALLSNLSASDFAYIPHGYLLERSDHTLKSMHRLERFRGHFFNWYDTATMAPLRPRYISAVDSGNLAGHLLTLRQGLFDLEQSPIVQSNLYEGIDAAAEIVAGLGKGVHLTLAQKLRAMLESYKASTGGLHTIGEQLESIHLIVQELASRQEAGDTELTRWTIRLDEQVSRFREEIKALAPWCHIPVTPERFRELGLDTLHPTLEETVALPQRFAGQIAAYRADNSDMAEMLWLGYFEQSLTQASEEAGRRIERIRQLGEYCEEMSDYEFDFLTDRASGLLRIGYNVEEQLRDNSFYDLLASEVRLGIFTAIAQGKLDQESWFSLGRLLTNAGTDPVLLSWSGSMFEYLMPDLVMPVYEGTLLHQTARATVMRQIEYAAQKNVPWGISESGYNMVDANLNYQYRAFGVPGLGLKRGLEDDLVIAPYATMLALMVLPGRAAQNLQTLSQEGFEGEYGMYEAIDYTASRLPRGKQFNVIQSYMVHHQGMGLLSLVHLLKDRPMQQRFSAERRFQATMLLLQERMPKATNYYNPASEMMAHGGNTVETPVRVSHNPSTPIPEVQLLSNGRYQVMVTNSGGGYSRWKDMAVTRWREDSTRDDRGIFCYIRDTNTGDFWSNTYQPTLHQPRHYDAVFSQGHVEFRRHDFGIDTRTEIVISPEDDVEIRRVRLTNKSQGVRILEVTSFTDVVMAPQAADEAHPAFSNLFVQTEILPEYRALYCSRRARTASERPPWMFHLMHVRGATVEAISYETDRMQFIGRGRTTANPQALERESLSGSHGAVLDPVLSIRYRIALKPYQSATVDLIFGIHDTRDDCDALMHKYRDPHLKNRAFELAWTHSQVLLRQINATEADAQLYDKLAGAIIYPNPYFRAEPSVILNNYRGQSGLWSHSVSGDLPIVLLHVHDSENLDLIKQLIQAHTYWKLKGLAVDLVIWNEDHGSYRQLLMDQISGLIAAENYGQGNRPGNVYVRSADQISAEDRLLFESVARVIISDLKGSLTEQVNRKLTPRAMPPDIVKTTPPAELVKAAPLALPGNLVFYNGTGGFTPDGKEYKILTHRNELPPAPWVNVLANDNFGTVISESGSAYTWAINAHEYRITPWNNDPVGDIGGEAFYLRDEETGQFWSPVPFPAKDGEPYITTHGFGYSEYEHRANGIYSKVRVTVDTEDPVKMISISLKNESGRTRKVSVTGMLEIILGEIRAKTNMHVFSEFAASHNALLLRNRYNTAFAERVSFFRVSESNQLSYSSDRTAFIGRNRSLSNPAALGRQSLSDCTGATLDPCAALQVKFDLLADASRDVGFQIGSSANIRDAHELLAKLGNREYPVQADMRIEQYWEDLLGAVQVETPDTALNFLANGWIPYQTLVCRIQARSGFYQSGGAFGYRDQLQDVLSLLLARPEIARNQILLNASRQFLEGDVQHWWHPPEGRGVRTRCSDDMLWLPYAVARYVVATGDEEILRQPVGFLESRHLQPEEESIYDLPIVGNFSGSVYEHCVRAIRHSLRFGIHGLPLMGAGDWNDGMEQVGHKGSGESVWLAFFLYDVLVRFDEIARRYNDENFSMLCKKEASMLRANIEISGWDGQWYMRAYFDEGQPLGSHENDDCRIDAIAQSWAVLSGAANPKRAAQGMDSLNKHLVRRDIKLIQLLDPPFDKGVLNPGYIKGYVPGVRENGGQYSHAAIWTLMAFAALGNRERVWELFNLVNPVNHSLTPEDKQIYKVEPYVMAADVYANESHKGRGGWTWYTGSSGWLYQFITGSLLGMQREGNRIRFVPCFPEDWPSVTIRYRTGSATYIFEVLQDAGLEQSVWTENGTSLNADSIELQDDGKEHRIRVQVAIGQKAVAAQGAGAVS